MGLLCKATATPRLPKYAALCVEHRQVVGADDYQAVWTWAVSHAKLRRCTPPRVAETKVIRRRIVEEGLVEDLLGGYR
jgi:hypothetical protein